MTAKLNGTTNLSLYTSPNLMYTSTDPEKAVRLRPHKDGRKDEPVTITEIFKRIVKDYPENPAMMVKDPKKGFTPITYRQYDQKVNKIAKAFIKLGLETQHSVGLLAFNCAEWFISALAAVHAGGLIAGVYTTNSPDAVRHVLESSRANIVIVDDSIQMEKIQQIKDKLPMLKAIVQIQEPYGASFKKEDGCYTWAELENMEVDDVESEYKQRYENLMPNKCCCLVYTSGTIGLPKGVMLSHDNLVEDCRSAIKFFADIDFGKEIIVSYLPLSHVAAQVIDFYFVMAVGGCTYFADKDALKGTLGKTLLEARPTRFLGVPRVFEKMQDKIVGIAEQNSSLKKMIGGWAKSVTLRHHLDELDGKSSESCSYKFARYFLLSKVKAALGFDRCATIVSGAAPLSIDTKKYFLSLDIAIQDGFGLSETTGPHIVSDKTSHLDSIGKPIPGCDVKILNPDENGHGELLMMGRNIFMGYIGDVEKTKEALDDDGWMHSGDLAFIDEGGCVHITGRIKEILITAGGENIPPVLIENLIKKELPAISNAILVGERRKYLTVLLALKTEINADMSPNDDLSVESLLFMESLGQTYKTVTEIIEAGPCPKVLAAIQNGINRVNKEAISNAQKVQKFAILPHDFSIPTGELGPTLKLKRSVVLKMYEEVINKLYE